MQPQHFNKQPTLNYHHCFKGKVEHCTMHMSRLHSWFSRVIVKANLHIFLVKVHSASMTATRWRLLAAVPEFFPDLRLMDRFNEKPYWLHHSFNRLQISLQLKRTNCNLSHSAAFLTLQWRRVRCGKNRVWWWLRSVIKYMAETRPWKKTPM